LRALTGKVDRRVAIPARELEGGRRVLECNGPSIGEIVHRTPQDGSSENRWRAAQRLDVERSRRVVATLDDIGASDLLEFVRGLLQPPPQLARAVGFRGEDIDDVAVQALQQRNQFGPHAIARNRQVAVARVLDEFGEAAAFRTAHRQPVAQLATATGQQRPHDRSVPRVHAGETARPRAANEAQEKCFRLVIACVAHRNDVGAQFDARALERLVPRRVRRTFNRSPFAPRAPGHVGTLDDDRPPESVGERTTEPLVGRRGIAELMIQVHEPGELKLANRIELGKHVREGN
jgi:hypothetical protein